MLSKSGAGAMITVVTTAMQHVTISIPSQKGGVVKYFEVQVESQDLTSILDSGGDFWLRNTSADWAPFHGVTGTHTVVTEGGNSAGIPMRYYASKELPGNSTVYADYQPYDNQSQGLCLTIFWELGAKITKETFLEGVHPLKAAAKSSVARASHGNFTIPGGKGGRAVAIFDQFFGVLETVVNGGGLRELTCDAYDIEPCHKYTTYEASVGASGGGLRLPDITPYQFKVPDNAVFTPYTTAWDDQAQTFDCFLMWERSVRHRVVK